MANIIISVAGKDEFNRTFERYDAVFEDLSPIWPTIRDTFWDIEKEQFASEGSAGRSGKWQQLSEPYKAQKIKQFGNLPILVVSSKLKKSLTGRTADTVYRTTKKEIAVGTSLKYGLFHQTGTSKMPARPPINFSESQRKKIADAAQRQLLKILKQK